jgi:hypothetical protein
MISIYAKALLFWYELLVSKDFYLCIKFSCEVGRVLYALWL